MNDCSDSNSPHDTNMKMIHSKVMFVLYLVQVVVVKPGGKKFICNM